MHQTDKSVRVIVLGTAQDGGYPQAGCRESCCMDAWNDSKLKRMVSSLAILSGQDCLLIDITPDIKYQLHMIEEEINEMPRISGICITHAHMGHYMGLIELGLEVMNTNQIPIYVMPKMKYFLEENAPFTQLIDQHNIQLIEIGENIAVQINKNLNITPFQVPHRNEFSETVGFTIQSSDRSLLYISDIDSWEKWNIDINDLIRNNDILLLDGTFYSGAELPDRNLQDIPHPFIKESLQKISLLEKMDRDKVYFTHLNHSNPVINKSSLERLELIQSGCHIAEDGMVFSL